ncbi:MAG TPA: FG-GAP-like repeat-containing protein [Terriglobales bacterium]|nr:FG-GAP-like repeat-containing protein [Terriglobales bacterium]
MKISVLGAARFLLGVVLVMTSPSILFAKGFLSGRAYDVGKAPKQIAVADFNNDGRPDVVVVSAPTSTATATIQVLLTQTDGSLGTPIVTQATANLSAVAVGDFNHDGKQDLAVTDSVLNTVTIYLGKGDGTFTQGATYPTGLTPVAIVAEDVDGNSQLDLLVANFGDGTYNVFLGGGNGTFTASSAHAADVKNPNGIAVADLDGDGRPDLVVTGNDNDFSVARGNGDGTFQFGINSLLFNTTQPDSIAIGDLDGDGHPDLVLTTSENIVVLKGNGDLTFQNPVFYTAQADVAGIVLADVNGDKKLDIVVTNEFSNSFSVLLNNGNGTFSSAMNYAAGGLPTSIAAAGITGNALPDLVVLNSLDSGTSGDVEVFNNLGNGVFTAGIPDEFFSGNALGGIVDVALADFNHDELPDAAVLDGASRVNILLNSGGYGFSLRSVVGLTEACSSLVAGDVNGDGNIDLVVAGGTHYFVFLGNGDGTFTAPLVASLPQNANGVHAMALADFNHDQTLDLVLGNTTTTGTDIAVLLGTGNGTFGTASPQAVSGFPYALVTGDFNGDGNQDIAVAATNAVSVLLGVGDGTFQAAAPYAYAGAVDTALSIRTADLNSDGHPDLVVSTFKNSVKQQNEFEVFLGKADGSFQSAAEYPVTAISTITAVGDFDADGNLDIAATDGNKIDLFYGDGSGTFPGTPTILAIGNSGILQAADLTGSGVPDLTLFAGDDLMSIFPNSGGIDESLSATPTSSSYAQPIKLEAMLTAPLPSLPAATGAIHVTAGAQVLGDIQLPNTSLSTNSLPVGSNDIQLSYSGDGNYYPRALPGLHYVVQKATSTAQLSGPSGGLVNQTLAFSVQVAGEFGGTPSGEVQLLDGDAQIATQALDGSSQAQFSVATLSAGLHSLEIAYGGDSNFLASAAQPLTVDVQNATNVSLTSSAASASFGSTVTFSVAVGSTTAVPTGQVSFQLGSTTLGQVNLDTSGKASFSTSSLSGGMHDLVASYAGNSFFEPNSATTTVTVAPIASSIALSSSAQSAGGGSSVTFTAKLAPQFGTTPTGTVAFSIGSTNLGSTAVDNTGAAVFSTSSLPIGNDAIMATYSGDVNFIGVTSAAVNVNVTPDFQISPSATSQSVHPGQSASFRLNLAPFGSFAAPISFACSGLPALAACSFNPNSVTFTNSSSVAVAVTISTAGPSASLRHVEHPGIGGYFIYAIGGFGIIGLVLGGGTRRRSTNIIALCVLLVVVAGTIACGGGGSGSSGGGTPPPPVPTTPLGTSTVTVTASETQNGNTVSHQTQFTLTVD